jgi:hypothetical protein
MGSRRGSGLDSGRRAASPFTNPLSALLFFMRGVTFAWLIGATGVSVSLMGREWAHATIALGVVLALGGTLVNVWATRVVGLDTYYYRDLFAGGSTGELSSAGPYRVFRNPMYGVGQASGYGAALVSLSPAGILATLLNQMTMYLFNELVERPHLARRRIAPAGDLCCANSTCSDDRGPGSPSAWRETRSRRTRRTLPAS